MADDRDGKPRANVSLQSNHTGLSRCRPGGQHISHSADC
jgi:hypothetical protein